MSYEFRGFINKKLPRKRHAKVEDPELRGLGAVNSNGSFKGEDTKICVE
jgi:hypothetical protein